MSRGKLSPFIQQLPTSLIILNISLTKIVKKVSSKIPKATLIPLTHSTLRKISSFTQHVLNFICFKKSKLNCNNMKTIEFI